jgi:hypothetical protein
LLRVADFLSAKDAGLLDKIKRLGVE